MNLQRVIGQYSVYLCWGTLNDGAASGEGGSDGKIER